MFPWFSARRKVGLALGGGVARGIAHIGVLKVLNEYNIPIDCVAGTSSGALVGAAYAAGMEVSLIEQVSLHIQWKDLLKFTLFRPGFVSGRAIEELVEKYIGDKDFSELKTPFAAVATDINSGEAVVIGEGKVPKAVAASSAFPGFVAPEEAKGRFLIDGGISSNVPVDAARALGAEFVIASDVVPGKSVHRLPHDPMQVFGRSLDMILKKLSREEALRADVLIELEMEKDIWHLDLSSAKQLIAAGEVAAHRAINKIRKDLGIRS
ncbi:patatin-like phospholipase family protein [Candidatus Saganbacteria bacterium]|uniref:Patatin-like phospholipase family protein n=1 Tax=Candidatus Saganbacteria bacterium TaxID=2575572 RepID=A0A9D6ULX0_UNCSA|nr:patatin-like phospholipase family protein [Candidatus Saganbacteria bacterium]